MELKKTCLAASSLPVVWMLSALLALPVAAQTARTSAAAQILLVSRQGPGPVELLPAGANRWIITDTNQLLRPGDHLRTGPNTRVALLWSDHSVVPVGPLTEIEVLPPHNADADSGLHLFRGLISFFHRDKPGRIRFIAGGAHGGIDGTEFVLEVANAGGVERTLISVIDGIVRLSNEQGTGIFTNGQQAVAQAGRPPELRAAGFIANNVLQWCFYYPAVLDLRDLPLTATEQQALAQTLAHYRSGDLLAALAAWGDRVPASDAERIYYAALLLSVGQAAPTEDELNQLPAGPPDDTLPRLANALRQLIAAVKRQSNPSTFEARLATEFLAASYYEQSRATGDESLKKALDAARHAAELSPNFSFARARVAELEFSFGRTRAAQQAVRRSLELASRNAEALSLNGFLFAARNKTREALVWFDRALSVDSALGNAWLGRGLCKIRLTPDFFSLPSNLGAPASLPASPASQPSTLNSQLSALDDLLIAAAFEPQRSLLRSYLGKAWTLDRNTTPLAGAELDRAIALDPADPTPWLYRALLNEQENRLNEAVRDLGKSQELNDNRRMYRSQPRLVEDRSIRSANLARLFDEAGLIDVGLREASRAVATDYANHSGHLFLANAYSTALAQTPGSLRYETAAAAEYLVSRLLAPPQASALSPLISQQEYLAMFDRPHLGLVSQTEYRSGGDWRQNLAHYGQLAETAYAVGADYGWLNGQRPNADLETRAGFAAWQQSLSPMDSVFAQVQKTDAEGGDIAPLYDPAAANTGLRFSERVDPLVVLGWHHRWSPSSHTLLLATHGRARQYLVDTQQTVLDVQYVTIFTNADSFRRFSAANRQARNVKHVGIELQQILESGRQQWVFGAKAAGGHWRSRSLLTLPDNADFDLYDDFNPTVELPTVRDSVFRAAGYAYWQLALVDQLRCSAGIAADYLRHPRNHDVSPFTEGEITDSRVLPKFGFIWQPSTRAAVRGSYTRSVMGTVFDQSLTIEPTSVAGINQLYRTIIPDALTGPVAGADASALGTVVEYRTFIGDMLWTDPTRWIGAFRFDDGSRSTRYTREQLDYRERSLTASAQQLTGDWLTLRLSYRIAEARLDAHYPDITADWTDATGNEMILPRSYRQRSIFHELRLALGVRQSGGWFVNAEARLVSQDNSASIANVAGDTFWQVDVEGGFRSRRRQFQATVGLLNLFDEDYRLHPLSLHSDYLRQRSLALKLGLGF
jgi:Tfp pilus assembly protein PilF